MWTKSTRKIVLFCLAFLLSLGLCINHVTAQSIPFYWEFINVDIAVENNGDMLVSETQKYTFTGKYKNQRSRYISLDKVDEITDISVSENGQVLSSQTGIENKKLWIRWSHKLKAPESHTFVLKYRVVGGLHVDTNDDDQVYWKAIFADHQAPIKQAKVQVKIPEQVTNGINNFQSFGVPAKVRKLNPKIIEFVAQRTIKPQEELEVQVTFNPLGTDIKTPQWQTSNSWNLWIVLGILLFSVFRGNRGSGYSVNAGEGDDAGDGGDSGGDGGDGGGDGGGGGGGD